MLVAVTLALLGGGEASAKPGTTIQVITPPSGNAYQQWSDASRMPGPTETTVNLSELPCGSIVSTDGRNLYPEHHGWPGCAKLLDPVWIDRTQPNPLIGVIWLDPGALAAGGFPSSRWVFLHELGHIFDLWELDDGERLTFSRIVQPLSTRSGFPLGEVFAETYARCSLGARMKPRVAILRAWLSWWRFQRACRFILYE